MTPDLKRLRELHAAATRENAETADVIKFEIECLAAFPAICDRIEELEGARDRELESMSGEWLSARDARMKREGAAEELERLRDHIQEYIGPDDARDDIRRICASRANDLREEK